MTVEPGEGDWQRCPCFYAGTVGVLVLGCVLPEGHEGMHRTADTVEWCVTLRDGRSVI